MRRSNRIDVNLRQLIYNSIENLEDSKGGGHPGAAGCQIKRSDVLGFIENLEKNLTQNI